MEMRRIYGVVVTEGYSDVPADPQQAMAPILQPIVTTQHERIFTDGDEARSAYFTASKALTNAGIVPGYQDVVDRWRELTKHGALGHEQVELHLAGDQLLRALEHELGRR
jgi:hypothetical protein